MGLTLTLTLAPTLTPTPILTLAPTLTLILTLTLTPTLTLTLTLPGASLWASGALLLARDGGGATAAQLALRAG